MRTPLRETVFAVLLAACTAPPEASSAPLETEARDEGIELGAANPSYTPEGPSEVLDRRADGAVIRGALLPALRDTDEEPVYRISLDVEPSLDGTSVLAAAFVEGGIVTVGPDHVLRMHRGGEVTELDSEALGPLSVAGTRVAYVRGVMPSYELALADVATGEARALTTDMAPVWSPALAANGDVVFVSGVSGAPRLHRIAGGVTQRLEETPFFPSSLRAPRFDGSVLSFEDETGQPHSFAVRVEVP